MNQIKMQNLVNIVIIPVYYKTAEGKKCSYQNGNLKWVP